MIIVDSRGHDRQCSVSTTGAGLKPGTIIYLDGAGGMAKINKKYYRIFDPTAQKVSLKKQKVTPKKGHTFPWWSLVPWIATAAVIILCRLLGILQIGS